MCQAVACTYASDQGNLAAGCFMARSTVSKTHTVAEGAIKKVTQALYLGALHCGTSFCARKQFECVELPFKELATLNTASPPST